MSVSGERATRDSSPSCSSRAHEVALAFSEQGKEGQEVVILKEYIIARHIELRPAVTVATLAFVALTLGQR